MREAPAKIERECQLFLTVSETAQYRRLCEKQVRRLIWRGELPAYRFGTALGSTTSPHLDEPSNVRYWG